MDKEEAARHLSFARVTKSTIGLLKIIHSELLPVRYSPAVYDMIRDSANTRGELAFLCDDVAVGEICFRLEEVEGVKKLYLMTIGVLPTYQKLGIATKLLGHAIEEAKKMGPFTEIYLHVHAENAGAMEFYEKMGFTKGALEEKYYKSLENGDAYVFSKAA
jgi:ribosomal protein S18 acetylase RimI-like enzyme